MRLEFLRTSLLQELHDAQCRLIRLLPTIAQAGSSEELRAELQHYIDQSAEHVLRLGHIFELVAASSDEAPRSTLMPGAAEAGDTTAKQWCELRRQA
jgi:ferritin-like metal-binding protein YciE